MKIEYTHTNLVYIDDVYIAHGVNCLGVMGAGVAKAIRYKYPEVYNQYKDICDLHKDNPKELLGTVVNVADKGKIIMNCFTQLAVGSGMQVDYDAIRSCMKEVNSNMIDIDNLNRKKIPENPTRVAMPKIGSGLGGGDWTIISKIIEEESTHFQPVVCELVK